MSGISQLPLGLVSPVLDSGATIPFREDEASKDIFRQD